MNTAVHEMNNLIYNLKQILPLANSHMVNFITQNMFETIIPKSIQDEIMDLEVSELNHMVLNNFLKVRSESCNDKKTPNLTEFLYQTQKLLLKQSDICLPFEKLYEKLGSKGFNECSFHIVKNLMSAKKSHEVEKMTGIVAALAKTENCSHIVDIGGGKGYLGSILALKHQLKVLSIDSSIITSEGAARHIPKVQKFWNILGKKSPKSDTTVNKDKLRQECSCLCKLATLFITEETDVVDLLKDHFQGDKVNGVMLAGLHTCGNLAATSLRLFANSPEHIRCLVNVGCCYHLIVEEFDTTPPWLGVESKASGFGFPMSSHLRDVGFVLGRNARMLAAQPPDRFSHEGTLQTEALFYRALLECYLEKKLCHANGLPHFRVGKLAGKCYTFVEYVHKSIERLGLDIQVDDIEVQQLYNSHTESRKQLHAFFLLRLAVAPVIEATIMLDRLLYLQEKGIENAYLTQLFDPVVSPRCYAIVVLNKSRNSGIQQRDRITS